MHTREETQTPDSLQSPFY